MKPRTLLILLVVVLGLGAFIFFYERKLPSSEERVTLGKKVFALEKDAVTALTLETGKGTVRLERAGPAKPAKKQDGGVTSEPAAEWKIIRPLTARADTFAVDRLLDSITGLEKTSTIDQADPKAVGLDKPRATVRLSTTGGEKVLKIGAEIPPGGSTVVGVEGRKEAYVVADTILADLEKPPGEWRNRTLFLGDRERISKITITSGAGAPGGPVVLAKHPEGFWMERPVADRADNDLVEGLLSDLTGLTADRFVDGPLPADAGLNPPQAVVDVAFSGVASPVRVELGAPVTGGATPEGQPSGEVSYVRIGDTVAQVRTRLGESARHAPADWRALQLSAFEVHEIESAVVREPGKPPLELTRAGTDWKRGSTTISYLPASDLLFAVTSARATKILAPSEAQPAQPVLTFDLKTKEGNETLTLYPAIAGGVPARASGRNVVLLLPAETLGQIQSKVKEVQGAKAVAPEK
jgi:hypothetical protein